MNRYRIEGKHLMFPVQDPAGEWVRVADVRAVLAVYGRHWPQQCPKGLDESRPCRCGLDSLHQAVSPAAGRGTVASPPDVGLRAGDQK
jgi:hypothetical protein